MFTVSPLAGTRVVSLGQHIAAPVTAALLADQGAHVTHVEPADGPRWTWAASAAWQAGDEARRYDLGVRTDRESLRSLIEGADVVVEDQRPGDLAEFGFDPDAMLTAKPELVYCSIPNFGGEDPRSAYGWEAVVAAATATYRPPRDDADAPPATTPIPISSMFAAFAAATAVVAALLARERDGVGQHVEVSRYDATFSAMGSFALPTIDGEDPLRSSDIWGKGLYRCEDGRYVQICTANPRFLARFATAAGRDDWRAAGYLDRARLAADPALLASLRTELTELFCTRPAAAWEALVPDLPVTMVRDLHEWSHSDVARSGGHVRHAAGAPEVLRPGPAVEVHQLASNTVPATRASGDVESPASVSTRAPLTGYRVLDLSQVLAGPVAGRVLAEYGADVIKVNDPEDAPSGTRYHHDVNRGKRTVLLDLTDDGEAAQVRELVAGADVFIHNFAAGVAERLGIGAEALLAGRPELVYAWVTAFGTHGPWAGKRGYEVSAQAVTGMLAQMEHAGVPRSQPFLINDYGTGMLTAFGVLAGLYQRRRSGRGCRVDTSLARTATTLLSAQLAVDDPDAGTRPREWPEPPSRLLRASDGWVVVVGGDAPASRPLLDALPGDPDENLERRVSACTRSEVVAAAGAAAVAAGPVRTLDEAVADPIAIARGVIVDVEHDAFGAVRMTGPAPRLRRTPLRRVAAVAPAGGDADDVLSRGWHDG